MHNPKSLGVEPSQVEITGFEAGSLVVKAKINGLRDHHHAKEITGHVETKTKLASLLHKVGWVRRVGASDKVEMLLLPSRRRYFNN